MKPITDEELKAKGLTKAQIESNTRSAIFQVIAERQDPEADAIATWIEDKKAELETLKKDATWILNDFHEMLPKIQAANKNGIYNFDRCETNAERMALLFRNCLDSVQSVFGEDNMTENIIIAAINSASYAAWRVAPEQRNEEITRNSRKY